VLTVFWAVPEDARPEHDELLSAEERTRRARLLSVRGRKRSTVAYALSRIVLARELDADPVDLRIERTCVTCGGRHGKPRVVGADVRFSIAASADRVAVAVTRGAEIGVDVEQVNPALEVAELTADVLSDAERGASSPAGLLTYWTRKEAVLKATGDGLHVPLSDLTVSGPGEPPALLAWRGASRRFQLYDLHPGAGYLAALAVLGRPSSEVRELDGSPLLS
jgi:4'-phosphopantetheinyl transferase